MKHFCFTTNQISFYKAASIVLFLMITLVKGYGQSGVSINANGEAPDPSAMLDIQSDSKGILIPRLSTDQRMEMNNPMPATGLLVYDTDVNAFYYYNGLLWVNIKGSGKLEDADMDTKIQVEKNPDEDIIRFDVAGVEVMRHDGKTLHAYAPGGSLFIGTDAGTNDDGIGDGVENENTFIGVGSGYTNTVGIHNTFVGNSAGGLVNIGSANTLIGHRAGFEVSDGDRNTFIGVGAGYHNGRGDENYFAGYQAGFNNDFPNGNHFTGYQAGFSNTTGNNNQFIGYKAGNKNTSGQNNLFIGKRAGEKSTTGSTNLFVGQGAGEFNTTGGNNYFVGYKAGNSNTIGANNHFSGNYAGTANTTGEANTFEGTNAGGLNTTGIGNTALGSFAGHANATSNYNTCLGSVAGLSSLGASNTFVGASAGNIVEIGSGMTMVGAGAGHFFSGDGTDNTFIGRWAGASSLGSNNTLVGAFSGNHNGGTNNVFIGSLAGSDMTSGDDNTLVGTNTSASNGITNSLVLGHSTTTTMSNSAAIGFGLTRFGMGVAPSNGGIMTFNGTTAKLTLGGVWQNASDRSIKENVTTLNQQTILEKIMLLPVSQWNYIVEDDSIKHIGPMAQDFYSLFGLGGDETTVSTIDPAGVALVAIQALYQNQLDLKAAQLNLEAAQRELEAALHSLHEVTQTLSEQQGEMNLLKAALVGIKSHIETMQ